MSRVEQVDRGSNLPPTEQLEKLMQPDRPAQDQAPTNEDDYETEPETDQEDSESQNNHDVHGWMGNLRTTPALYSNPPLIKDTFETRSSLTQDAVAELCRNYMTGKDREIHDLNTHGIPHLQKAKHIKYMRKCLDTYPAPYQAMDASRPWILYWALEGLAHFGQDVRVYGERAAETFAPLQNGSGGFGGGHGQTSHIAASYAATLSLALAGRLDSIDRRTMWQWLGSLKQGDGGFAMAVGGEIDVRGAYCTMTILSLLNLPLQLPTSAPAREAGLETFVDGLGEWIGTCQTFEGGIGSAPDNEAHGAYAFCGLACLSILDAPYRSIPKYLDVDRLLAWLAARQPAPEGGFSGRTNKLVDACYSHWVGGCWALLEAAIYGPNTGSVGGVDRPPLWNREALVRYTLCCSQTKNGGLRDKPGTRQDGYHTNYSSAGLSAAQNHWSYHEDASEVQGSSAQGQNLPAPYRWRGHGPSKEEMQLWAFDEQDILGLVHPVFVMPPDVVERTKKQFSDMVGF